MAEIQAELSATDYLALKAFEAEYRILESELLQNNEETE